MSQGYHSFCSSKGWHGFMPLAYKLTAYAQRSLWRQHPARPGYLPLLPLQGTASLRPEPGMANWAAGQSCRPVRTPLLRNVAAAGRSAASLGAYNVNRHPRDAADMSGSAAAPCHTTDGAAPNVGV